MTALPVVDPAPRQSCLTDGQRRQITYLRISVTDRCNLRCQYCLPASGISWLPKADLLTCDELTRIAAVAARCGVRKVRVTGGEPLLRPDLVRFVRALSDLGLAEVCLSTNGLLLAQRVEELRDAGLDRVNISLDTLRPDRYRELTRGGELERVFDAIDAALAAGLAPRLNVVAMPGFNEDELADFAALTVPRPLTVRFIELMPFGPDGVDCTARNAASLPVEEIAARLGLSLPAPQPPTPGSTAGPAVYTRLPGARGRIGFIAAMHDHICAACNRVRLASDGRLRACLLGAEGVSLKAAARAGDDAGIEALFRSLLRVKPAIGLRTATRVEAMAAIGG